ncbi:MAG: efflux RND transporter permease subunit [Rickettsiaceae bacterium]|nr:efflux RND transporter permease subunit [Rickettsiaceae bacterium]
MLFSEVCIRRPVFATVLNILVILFGILAYSRMEVRESPNIEFPLINITSTYPGADASYMEQNVTNVLETVIRSLEGLDYFTSSSSAGTSTISVYFKYGVDIHNALNDTRAIVANVSSRLPLDMVSPSVAQMQIDAFPVIWLSASSDRYDSMALTNIIGKEIVPEFEKISTVAAVKLYGSRDYTLYIEPYPEKLYAFNLTPSELEQAVKTQSIDYPAGLLRTDNKNFVLSINSSLNSVGEFENIIVKKNTNKTLVLLKDVAKVSLKPLNENTIVRYNGSNAIAIGIIRKPESNLLDLSRDVKKTLAILQEAGRSGVSLAISVNTADSLQESISSVYETLFEAVFLVAFIVYLFMGSLRLSLIPLITIPVSLVGAFSLMKLCGYSINLFSLFALVLAIGLVVDDAIVVLENIYRRREGGVPAFESSILALREITFAVVVMTITLVAVFLPIGFIQGIIGELFIEFAWTLAFSVLVSGFVALTLTPMLASKVLKRDVHINNILTINFNKLLHYVENVYLEYLEYFFNNKMKFFAIAAASVIIMVIGFIKVPKTFDPTVDTGSFQVRVVGPDGSTLKNTEVAMLQAAKLLGDTPEVAVVFTINGFGGSDNNGFSFTKLKNVKDRKRPQPEIVDELNKKFANITEAKVGAFNPTSSFSQGSHDIEFNIVGDDFKSIDKYSEIFVEAMLKDKMFLNPERVINTSVPSLDIAVDRNKAYLYGVSMDNIGRSLQYLIASRQVGTFMLKGESYGSYLRYDPQKINKVNDLVKIYLKNTQGTMFSLADFVKIQEEPSVAAYTHKDGRSIIGIFSSFGNIQDLTLIANHIRDMAKDILPPELKIEFKGQIKEMANNNIQMITTFLLALAFIYLVLAAQFESFKDPLLILCSVPFSITGALLALIIGGSSLNLYSNIGMITLIGLVTKNAIMIIEFANQQITLSGVVFKDAIVNACKLRFRPILMTSLATILGSIPLIIATGSGSEARNSIGLTIVGGMIVSTVFTVFVIPILYYLFSSKKYYVPQKEVV